MKRKVNMTSKLTGMTMAGSVAGGTLDGSGVSELGERLMTGVAEPLVPKGRRGGSEESGGRRKQRVEGPGTVTPEDLAPSRKILHRTTKRIKFHTAVIVNSKLTNRYKILNKIRSKKNIVKVKVVRKVSCAGGGDRYTATVTNNNAGSGIERGR
jgi:hypothetical protein